MIPSFSIRFYFHEFKAKGKVIVKTAMLSAMGFATMNVVNAQDTWMQLSDFTGGMSDGFRRNPTGFSIGTKCYVGNKLALWLH